MEKFLVHAILFRFVRTMTLSINKPNVIALSQENLLQRHSNPEIWLFATSPRNLSEDGLNRPNIGVSGGRLGVWVCVAKPMGPWTRVGSPRYRPRRPVPNDP